jgi:outer membrane protein TolC
VLDQPHPAGQAALAPVNDTTTEHPRLMVRRAALEAADQSARVEALGARPDFTVMTRYGARPLGADFFSAFVGIRLPLFAGRKQSRQAEAARAEADAARASLAEAQASLAADLRGTLARSSPRPTRRRTPRFAAIASGRSRSRPSWRPRTRAIGPGSTPPKRRRST